MKQIYDAQQHKRRRFAIAKSSFANYDSRHMYSSVAHSGGLENKTAVNGNKKKHQAEPATKGSGVNVMDKMKINKDINGDIRTQNLPPEVNGESEQTNGSDEDDNGYSLKSAIGNSTQRI